MRIATLVAGVMETTLAQLLRFHPDPNPLARWQGQVVRLQLSELPFPLFLILRDPIQVYSEYDGDTQAQLSLSLLTLRQVSQGASLSTLVKEGALEIEGDMQLVGKLANLLGAIEPDLAEPLSRYLGDAMAYRVDQTGRALLNRAEQDLNRLHQHTGEVLREELRLAPGQSEVAHFVEQVDALAQQVEQLAHRLTELERRS
ncbi:ubiquinone biosynthesis accessory factor UbiJ [Ferrimonas balearica]|uniref:ubiquinone biosynthesis accessory factor UbiJ n=1 Tax=Ferrimonas balearica TaxID=44012 RepID=UPI001F46F7F4|nr:SCP2 sterol-binding domain-containing protein [Ferrimonas balearica]MBY6019204.1 SCP2 sterol-binding domain-containing protein [Halomonas denitrificans]MBY6095807.1 SCP2 sterol-binding domain-containing protein [Ferrimonas balearica]